VRFGDEGKRDAYPTGKHASGVRFGDEGKRDAYPTGKHASSLRFGDEGKRDAYPTDAILADDLSRRLREKFGPKAVLSLNPAGLGDSAVAVYAASALAQCGIDVTLHTPQASWLSRVRQPGLEIIDAAPPTDATPLYRDYDGHLRYAGSRAYWMSGSLDIDLVPCRPAEIDRAVTCDRLGFDHYVVLAPFAMWKTREWPSAHWIRLTHLLSESGYDVIALGSHLDAERIEATFNKTYAFWAAQQEPEWIIDVMLGADVVIGNDSGLTHLAGLLDVPTIALHAHLPPEVLWDCTNVHSLAPQTACTFCRWQSWRGYKEPCDDACSALATIGPESVMQAVELVWRAQFGGVGAPRTRGTGADE
jgi:heptosyltransferase-1